MSPQTTFLFAPPQKISEVEATPSNGKALRPGTGYCSCYDFVCNPYIGCAHACKFCYAKTFVPEGPEKEAWGSWLKYKQGCLSEIKANLGTLAGKSILLSSATDPYQPAESQLGLTRSILKLLESSPVGQPELHLITRSPMVLKDIPIIQRFHRKWVTISITSDDPAIHRIAEPKTTSYENRWKMLEELSAANIPVRINLCPLLRVLDPKAMIERIRALKPDSVYIDTPHHRATTSGQFIGTTPDDGLQALKESGWNEEEALSGHRALQDLLHKGN